MNRIATPLAIIAAMALLTVTPTTAQTGDDMLSVTLSVPAGDYIVHVDAAGRHTIRPTSLLTLTNTPKPNPKEPPTDELGLISFVQGELAKIEDYENKTRDAARLAAVVDGINGFVEDGRIRTPSQAKDALEFAVRRLFRAPGDSKIPRAKWQPLLDAIDGVLLIDEDSEDIEKLEQAYNEIVYGLTRTAASSAAATMANADESKLSPEEILSSPAFGDGEFLKWLIEVLLPAILKIIALFAQAWEYVCVIV